MPLAQANSKHAKRRFAGVVLVSDNQSWVYAGRAFLRTNGGRKGSVWRLRRQFEACHGVLTEDLDLPSREIDAEHWEDPLKD